MINISQLTKKYGSHVVLDVSNLSLSKPVYWLQGGNGSGKTTLLKALGGFIPFEGDCFIDQVSLVKQPTEYRRLVSYAEAEPLYPTFISGHDLITFYQKTRNAPIEQTNELLQRWGVTDYYKNPIGSYSSGMIKKLSLVLAFMGSCRWILLDEPWVTLDASAQRSLTELINVYAERGTGFLLTSHQPPDDDLMPLVTTLRLENKTVVHG